MTRIDRRQSQRTDHTFTPQTVPRARRSQYRERDFGVGYGNSSGYGCTRRYASDWIGAPRFRCG